MVAARQHTGDLRWVDYARRSMQRLGFVKVVLQLASKADAQTLEGLTRAFFATVTKRYTVPPERREAFDNYVRQQQLHRRYRPGCENAEIQDLWLADENLPSRSGAITGDLERSGYRHAVYVEIPTWATRLHLIRDHNYTLTDRGRVLLMSGIELSEFGTRGNPFHLSVAERYVSLFTLLDSDGDLLTAMYRELLARSSFTRADAGECAVKALEELRKVRMKNRGAGSSQEIRARMDRTIAAAKKQSGSGLGPRESIATPRTEPLVDCGILTKPRSDSYEYRFTDWGRSFLSALALADSVSDFVEQHLSAAVESLTGQSVCSDFPPLEVVARPYSRLRSGLGYVSIRELALAATADALTMARAPLFEISKIEESLRRAAGDRGREVRMAHGRTGGLAQVRIDPRIFGTS